MQTYHLLSNEYFVDCLSSYVLAAATSTFFINTYHSLLTSKFRKASGVAYPAAYASNEVAEKDPKAFAFNCGKFPLLPQLHLMRIRVLM